MHYYNGVRTLLSLNKDARRYRELFKLWGAFSRYPFSVEYTISTFRLDFQQGQGARASLERRIACPGRTKVSSKRL